MAIRAVGFDIGGVLQHVGPPEPLARSWQHRLGMSAAAFDAAVLTVDPGNLAGVGRVLEPELASRYKAALGLSDRQAAEFMADLWDRYCGVLDTELAGFAAGLRPQFRTGILSNSADGARREEQARHGIEDLVDVVIYSHEAGLAKPDPGGV
jgi:FMN phosphatase YigB (HAD superfamily)